ncbi:unnamed protein product, partial [marine sediment metagenome]
QSKQEKVGIDIGYIEGRGFSCDAANACVLPNRRFPYLGGPLVGLVYGLFWFCLDAQNQVISEEQEEVKMLNWKNFGEKRKEV